jgi:ComF family protein
LLLDHVVGERELESYDMVVPVPLHRNRLKERGYNQSELIADVVCGEFPQVKIQSILRRTKDTPSFSMLGAQERRNQIRNAFQLIPGTDVKKRKILLIDDVVTTTATTNECARTLRRAGAESIDVLALAVARRLE